MSEANKLIARRFFEELYGRGRLELVDELIAPEYVAHGPGAETNAHENAAVRAEGPEAVRRSIAAKPADIRVSVDEQIAEGDKVVTRLTFSSGGKTWAAVAIQKIVDGRLVETWRIANRGQA